MPSYVVTRLGDLLNDAGLALSPLDGAVPRRRLQARRRRLPRVARGRGGPPAAGQGRATSPTATRTSRSFDDLASVPLDGLDAYDAVVVLTPHPALDLDAVARDARLVLDTRAALPLSDRVHRL